MKQILKTILAKFKFAPVKYVMGIVKYRETLLSPFTNSQRWPLHITHVHGVFVFLFYQCILSDILLCTRTLCQNTRVQE